MTKRSLTIDLTTCDNFVRDNAIFGKIGRLASEKVLLQLVTRSSAIAVIADRTACRSTIG